jgi:hypothetical protein
LSDEYKVTEHTLFIDIKNVLCAIACGLGYWSHFVVKFPSQYFMVVVAVISYAVLMGIHWLIENKLERSAFYIASSISAFPSANKVYLHSDMDQQKTSIAYELTVTVVTGSSEKQVKVKYDCTKLFDTHGYLHLQEVHANLIRPCLEKLGVKKKTE